MAFAVGGRANVPALSETVALVATVEAAATNASRVTLLDTGGQPQVSKPYDLKLNSKNDLAKDREIQRNGADLSNALATVRPSSGESNPLDALTRAADAVRAGSGTGTIVLVDSGLQTTGALDYTQPGMLAADPDELVTSLSAVHQLPDLSGMTVFLAGIGDTAPPQEALDGGTRSVLRSQWQAIVGAAGATCVAVDQSPLTGAATNAVPEVSLVKVPQVHFDVPAPGKPLMLREQVRFQSNSDQYVDPESVREALKPTAKWMATSGLSVTLTGTTATDGTAEGRKTLSLRRAEAVKKTLVELGADASTIATKGVGTEDPSHVDDLDAHGRLIPARAALNRLVIVATP